ncbi:hypothetical protein B0I08_101496 [Glaciihabitans tibetensis]|uniref:YtxH-like protein n=1 Tax=Glaciihabitans tibetensis TaxID=1266600 RepID=A0A2T0VJH2_9MICO|nr:hypothetical protein [Glaciihabitans tibetensis]PRY70362.1 hypothetical protein B0I08_101496 [Glaciihabitans tibetensis]
MKKLSYLAVGVVLGFVVAHLVSRHPSGKRFFDDIDGKVREFSGAVVDGYRGREAELRATAADAEATLDNLTRRL